MNERKINIQLEKFLKKENWEFHYALSAEPDQKWIVCFREVCAKNKIDADIKGFSVIVVLGKINHFASITGGIFDSESELREKLEGLICKTNTKFCASKELIVSK